MPFIQGLYNCKVNMRLRNRILLLKFEVTIKANFPREINVQVHDI